jgi:2-polyprenyl-3-methyl-5-hydroxy-6-metoxy-1,4-benzoquinol methylase
MDYKFINNCLCCLRENKSLLNLGNIPLANSFSKTKENKCYPLELMICSNCYHCQLHCIINPEILFKDYMYVSGTSQTGLQFFKENAEFITNYTNGKKILDIACNDGSQLNYFKELNWETYGVDPATNLAPIAEKNGHKIICDFWNKNIAKTLPIMDVILAQNVFAHTEYIDDFLQACKIIMDNNSILFIQTSQKNMIINSEFDTIYHEHISFFNTKSMDTLVKRNGLVLNKIHENKIHGTSYIFEIRMSKTHTYNIERYLLDETNKSMYSQELYDTFSLNAKSISKNLKEIVNEYRSNGYKCIGYGAAAKGQTVLCYAEIELDYIVDENPLKIGLYSPKMNIPIVSFNDFVNDSENKYLIIILAWNFADEIINKIKSTNHTNYTIIESYFPKLKIIK